MNLKEFLRRINDGEVKPSDIPMLAFIILIAIIVVGGEIGCIIWFLVGLISAIFDGIAKLLTLIPCVIIISILSAIIWFIGVYLDDI